VAEDADREDESPQSEESPPESEPPPSGPFVPPSPDEVKRRAVLLADRKVQARMLAAVSRCAEQQKPDILQQAWADVLSAPEISTDLEEAKRQVFRATDAARKRHYRPLVKANVDPDLVMGATRGGAREPIPQQLRIAKAIAENLAKEDEVVERTLNVLDKQHLEGEPLHVATAYYGTTPEAHHKQVATLRTRIRAIMGVLLTVVAVFVIGKQQRTISDQASDLETARKEIDTLKTPTLADQAAPTVSRALKACANEDWAGCLAELDRAAAIDPAVGSRPDVVVARRAAVAALRSPPPQTPPPDTTSKGPGIPHE
jgi:hypothetical protein